MFNLHRTSPANHCTVPFCLCCANSLLLPHLDVSVQKPIEDFRPQTGILESRWDSKDHPFAADLATLERFNELLLLNLKDIELTLLIVAQVNLLALELHAVFGGQRGSASPTEKSKQLLAG